MILNATNTGPHGLNNIYNGSVKICLPKAREDQESLEEKKKKISYIRNTMFYQDIFDQTLMKYGFGFTKNQLLKEISQLM
mgnify:CR=1 FL=1